MLSITEVTRLMGVLGINRAVFYSLLNRGWALSIGLVTLFAVGHWLSSVEQGYFYTFTNLVALQVIFELGMVPTITQYVAHESSRFETNASNGYVAGDDVALSRAVSFIRASTRWFRFACMTYIFLIGGLGLFVMRGTDLPVSMWIGPWLLFTSVAAFRLLVTVYEGVFEGLGYVTDVAIVRLAASVAGGTALCVAIACGVGLYGQAIQFGFIVCISGLMYAKRFGMLYRVLMKRPTINGARIDFRREIFPYQWRIAVSWLSGFFIFQLFAPVLLRCAGAVEAGKFGMGLQLGSAITGIGSAWLSTRLPEIGRLTAQKSFDELRRKMAMVLLYSVSAVILTSAFAFAFVKVIAEFCPDFRGRLPQENALLLVIATVVLNQVVFVVAGFSRAQKREPFMLPSIAVAIATVSLLFFFAPTYKSLGAGLAYFLPTLLIAFPSALFIQKSLYR